jgi:hypothetical protein
MKFKPDWKLKKYTIQMYNQHLKKVLVEAH